MLGSRTFLLLLLALAACAPKAETDQSTRSKGFAETGMMSTPSGITTVSGKLVISQADGTTYLYENTSSRKRLATGSKLVSGTDQRSRR